MGQLLRLKRKMGHSRKENPFLFYPYLTGSRLRSDERKGEI